MRTSTPAQEQYSGMANNTDTTDALDTARAQYQFPQYEQQKGCFAMKNLNSASVKIIMCSAYQDLRMVFPALPANSNLFYTFNPDDVVEVQFHDRDSEDVIRFVLSDGTSFDPLKNAQASLAFKSSKNKGGEAAYA